MIPVVILKHYLTKKHDDSDKSNLNKLILQIQK